MTKVRQYFVLPALPIAAFLVCTIFLQTKKTPWVDECYTYYGITHDNWGEFVDSICSGINFSPPLYFFLNWIIQLIFHIPIEALRIESALWISLGSFLIFLRCAKTFGSLSAFLGCTMVLLQSNLLSEQALEARHYGMLFACSSGLLLWFPQDLRFNSQTRKILYSLALLSLGLTHYLGIVFCAIAGLARLWFLRKERSKVTLLFPEISSFAVIITVYLIMLLNQSSHLNTWEKDNSFSNLLSQYLGSLAPLTIVIPILLFGLLRPTRTQIPHRQKLPKIVLLSILWFLVPMIFWIISHVSTFNLFKDRYFIPKEAAVMVLISYFFHRIIPMFGTSKSSLSSRVLPLGGTFLVCISLLLLSSKRTLFGFDPSRDYHHKLLSNEAICNNPLPKLYSGDHLFFPNHYSKVENANIRLIVPSKRLMEVYRRFNSSITTQSVPGFDLQSYILIMDRAISSSNHILPSLGQPNVTLRKITGTNGLINAYKIEITETKPE